LFGTLWAITKNSFIEIIRQPIYGILLAVGIALIALSPPITMFALHEDVKLLVDMGLGTILMVSIILAVLSATQVVSREIEAKTAGAIMSKPVGRFLFVAGKFLGVTLAMALASYLFILFLMMTIRLGVPSEADYTLDWPVFLAELGPLLVAAGLGLYANYFYRWNFTCTAVLCGLPLCTLAFVGLCLVKKDWSLDWFGTSFVESGADQAARAAVLVALGVWVMSAVALAVSTRAGVVANVMICLGVFFLGMVSHYLFGWTVVDPGVAWAPGGEAEAVQIAGQVRGPDGAGVAGVRMMGAPGSVTTDASGRYSIAVRREGSGKVTPRKLGYVFNPPSRAYTGVAAEQTGQDFTAIRYAAGLTQYASAAGFGLAWLAYHAVPSLQFFWVADQLQRPEPFIPMDYVGRAALYAGAWCAALVAFGAFLFERRELI